MRNKKSRYDLQSVLSTAGKKTVMQKDSIIIIIIIIIIIMSLAFMALCASMPLTKPYNKTLSKMLEQNL